MAFVASALAVLGVLYLWLGRAKSAAHLADDVADMAGSVIGAANRWNFRRTHDKHPVECIDEQNIAFGALAVAFLELGGMPTTDDKAGMNVSIRSQLRISAEDADEVMVLGHWLVGQCGTVDAAVTRIGRRLFKLTGPRGLIPVREVIDDMVARSNKPLTAGQQDALAELDRIFKA